MKKITLILMAIVSFNFGSAQFLEDFNGTGAAFPPAGWAVYAGANGLGTVESWEQAGTDPEFRAFNLWEAVTAGQDAEDWMVSPLIPINSTQNVLLFDATDFNQGDFGSELSIRISTTSQTDVTTFTEIENLDESELGNNATTVFTSFNVNLAAYLNQSVYIAFVHVQNDGDAVTFDNVEVVQGAANPPGVANTPTPADMATGIVIDTSDANADGAPDNSILFGWSPDGSLGALAPDEYEILLGDSPTTLVSLGVAPATITLPTAIRGFLYNTTYYWQVIPRNTAGEAMNPPVWSFTTEVGSVAAPGDASVPTPADMSTVALDITDSDGDGNPDNAVDFSWAMPTTGGPVEQYIFRLGTTNAVDLFASNRGNTTTLRLSGLTDNTTYFWRVDPQNVGGVNDMGPVWQFNTGTASIDENQVEFFTLSPNPTKDFINFTTEETISNVTVYNALSQEVLKGNKLVNNRLDVSSLKAGLYIVKATSELGTQSSRFIKF